MLILVFSQMGSRYVQCTQSSNAESLSFKEFYTNSATSNHVRYTASAMHFYSAMEMHN